MPISSPFRDVEIPNVDLWTFYMERPREYPDDHTLFADSEAPAQRSYTFARVKELSVALGKGLKHRLGWSKGDTMALYSPNDIDTPVVGLGVHWAGGIVTPANPNYTAHDLTRQLRDSGAKALITHKAFLQSARRAAQDVGLPLDRVFLLGRDRDESGQHLHWTDITAADARVQPSQTAVDPKKDLAYLVYSSGTTGLPKGVMLTHRNVAANSAQVHKQDVRFLNWDLDKQIGILPFFHIYGLSVVINATLISGATCLVMARFDLEKTCQLVQEHQVTFLFVPPPIILQLSKHSLVSKYDLSSIRFICSGAAPLSRELVANVWKRLRIGVKQGYGLSESSPVAVNQFPDEWWQFQGSVGRLVPNMQGKIVDLEGKELPAGQEGELLLKGPNVFSGYWNRPEINKETFTADGWYRTGDIGYFCAKGHFYVTDRLKELIKYKGFQVPPAELENKLLGHPDIADVGVVGVWDRQQYTEIPRAYVVPRPGLEPSDKLAQDIAAWLSERVAPPKRLRGGVRFVQEIPKLQAGKILRRVLKDMAKKEDEPQAKL